MTRQYLELIGLLATKSEIISTYHIDYVYRLSVGGALEGMVYQKGFDFNLHIPFQEIVRHLASAYAPALQKQWSQQTETSWSVLLALHPEITPLGLGKLGKWKVDCEL